MNILVVDDNNLTLKTYNEKLTQAHYNVDCANNGDQALQLAYQNPAKYDLILMDLQMPIKSGYETATEMRQHGIQIPIIAMSVNAFAEKVQKIEAAGMNTYIPKPLSISALNAAITRLHS